MRSIAACAVVGAHAHACVVPELRGGTACILAASALVILLLLLLPRVLLACLRRPLLLRLRLWRCCAARSC
jgi:hypothetical protein